MINNHTWFNSDLQIHDVQLMWWADFPFQFIRVNHDINPFINLNFPRFERFIILERPSGGDLKLLEWSRDIVISTSNDIKRVISSSYKLEIVNWSITVNWLNLSKRLGLQINLAEDANEQQFVNSVATYSSSWLRMINFTDDQFQGETWNVKARLSTDFIKIWSFFKTGLKYRFRKPTKNRKQQSI